MTDFRVRKNKRSKIRGNYCNGSNNRVSNIKTSHEEVLGENGVWQSLDQYQWNVTKQKPTGLRNEGSSAGRQRRNKFHHNMSVDDR